MHTSIIKVDEYSTTWTVHHNGGFDGDIEFQVQENQRRQILEQGIFAIPFEVLLELVGRWLISQKVAELEQMDGKAIFKEVT